MMKKKVPQRGFSFIYIVMVLAMVTFGAALTSSQLSLFSARRAKLNVSAAEARMIGMQCAENLLMQVRNNTALISSGTLSIQSGTCTYSVSGTNPNKTITITAIRNNVYKKITITTTQTSPVILSSWVETS